MNIGKLNLYKKIVGFTPKTIVLLSGGIVKETKKDGTIGYRSTKINEGDGFGVLWGEARTLATVELAMFFPKAVIIITSVPSIYEEIEKHSISPDRIILERKSKNTLSQIEEALKLINKRKLDSIVFVTNEYHMPRVRAFYEKADLFKPSNSKVKFISAENILLCCSKKYIKTIEKFKKGRGYQVRLQNEKRGLAMISHKYGKTKATTMDKLERVMQKTDI